jgi:hypothetical protein
MGGRFDPESTIMRTNIQKKKFLEAIYSEIQLIPRDVFDTYPSLVALIPKPQLGNDSEGYIRISYRA